MRRDFPQIQFHGIHSRYEEGFSGIDKNLPTLFVFLGSTIGNFNAAFFVRFFTELSDAMGPHDFLLLGADRIKDIRVLERAYADSQGLTAEFIFNVFVHINSLVGSNFDLAKMRYHSWYNPEWQQIEMYAVSNAAQEIRFPSFNTSFRWEKNDRILARLVASSTRSACSNSCAFSIYIQSDTSPTLTTGSRCCSSKKRLTNLCS